MPRDPSRRGRLLHAVSELAAPNEILFDEHVLERFQEVVVVVIGRALWSGRFPLGDAIDQTLAEVVPRVGALLSDRARGRAGTAGGP